MAAAEEEAEELLEFQVSGGPFVHELTAASIVKTTSPCVD